MWSNFLSHNRREISKHCTAEIWRRKWEWYDVKFPQVQPSMILRTHLYSEFYRKAGELWVKCIRFNHIYDWGPIRMGNLFVTFHGTKAKRLRERWKTRDQWCIPWDKHTNSCTINFNRLSWNQAPVCGSDCHVHVYTNYTMHCVNLFLVKLHRIVWEANSQGLNKRGLIVVLLYELS